MNAKLAEQWAKLQSKADEGCVIAQYELGCLAYRHVDHDSAFKYWSMAASKEYAAAQFKIGWLYKQGKGVERSFSQAEAWYRRAAEQGLVEALVALEEMGPEKETSSNFQAVGVRAYDPTTGTHNTKIISSKE